MTPAGEKLDRFLAETIGELKGKAMPEIGGKKLAGEFSASFGGVRKALEEARLSIAGAVTELLAETSRISQTERVVRGETAALKKMNDDVLGNAQTTEQHVDDEQPRAD